MSLSSQLQNKDSLFSAFLRDHLPELRPATDSFRKMLGKPDAAALLLPQAPAGVQPLWGTLGAAIDHRLRYAFSSAETWDGAVELGTQTAVEIAWSQAGHDSAHAMATTAAALKQTLARLLVDERPDDRDREMLLPPAAEEHLARLCVAMSWFEEVYRSGYLAPTGPLAALGKSMTLPALLQAVPDYAARDLAAQVRKAQPALGPVRSGTTPGACRTGPVFAGSTDVDGADADLIAGTLMIDIKATKVVTRLPAPALKQLIGYALLDYPNHYGLTHVGLYLTRLGRLMTWDVHELVHMMGARAPLSDLRAAAAVRLSQQPAEL